MYCTKCGNKLDDSARFCNKCGASTGVGNIGRAVYEEPQGSAHNGTQGETYRDQADGYYESNQNGAYGGNRAGYSAPEGYAPYAPKAKSKKPLIIGISIAAAVVVIAAVVIIVALQNSSKNLLLNQTYFCYSEDDKEVESVFEYDENGLLATEIIYMDEKIEIDDYDENGNVIMATLYYDYEDDEKEGYAVDYWCEYQYEYQDDVISREYAYWYECWDENTVDDEGNIISTEMIEEYDGTTICDYEYEYDADGNIESIREYSHDDSADYSYWNVIKYEYDSKGRMEYEYRYYCDDPDDESTFELRRCYKYIYDNAGRVKKVLNITRTGGAVEEWSYWYEYEYTKPEEVRKKGETRNEMTFYDNSEASGETANSATETEETDGDLNYSDEQVSDDADADSTANEPESNAVSLGNAEIGDIVTFGSYEQDNNTSNGKEDIEWIVLDKEDGKALLISKYILDCQPYNEEDEEITWEDCTLRKWLNNDFLNTAFSSSQKNAIALSDIENADNAEYGTEGGEDTEDKIFLLSIDEAERYFASDDDRIAKLTDYGIERCIEESVEDGWYNTEDEVREEIMEEIKENEEYGHGWCWWVRSPGYDSYLAAYVNLFGYVHYYGLDAYYSRYGVRPALWVNLES